MTQGELSAGWTWGKFPTVRTTVLSAAQMAAMWEASPVRLGEASGTVGLAARFQETTMWGGSPVMAPP